jgi:hypothetical protein
VVLTPSITDQEVVNVKRLSQIKHFIDGSSGLVLNEIVNTSLVGSFDSRVSIQN